MKLLAWLTALGILTAGLTSKPDSKSRTWTVFVTGNLKGQLTPCGCKKPMQGGILRRSQVFSHRHDNTLVIDVGDWVQDDSEQSRLKAEALATLADAETDVIVLGKPLPAEWADNLKSLAGKASWIEPGDLAFRKGPFAVSITGGNPIEGASNQVQILVTSGDRKEAERIAKAAPRSSVVIYRSVGSAEVIRTAKTPILGSPGEYGKSVLKLEWNGNWTNAQVVDLKETIPDHPEALSIFREYQGRVASAKLIEQYPRSDTKPYGGSKSCQPCHGSVYESWSATKHANALATLEKEKSDRDPECVPCHVVGMDSVKGFRDREVTPLLANVGCESCHGPGADHNARPLVEKMPKINLDSCLPCHDAKHSPGFDAAEAWKKIAHGKIPHPVDNF